MGVGGHSAQQSQGMPGEQALGIQALAVPAPPTQDELPARLARRLHRRALGRLARRLHARLLLAGSSSCALTLRLKLRGGRVGGERQGAVR